MLEIVKNRLRELEATSKEFWNIPSEAGNFLNILIKSSNYKNIVEVGTSNGYSAIWLANALEYTDGHLVTIEFYEKRIELATENLRYCGLLDRVTLLQGSAGVVLEGLTGEYFNSSEDRFIDLAFIDACKGEYLNYYKIIDKKLRKGGMLIADNVDSHKEKVSDFLTVIHQNNSYQIAYLPFGGGMLLGLLR
jgi:predicted O-methyltransferase YrrM